MNVEPENRSDLKKPVKAIIENIVGFIQYHFASKRNHYPCKFMGEKANESDSSNVIILYQEKGRNAVQEIPIKDLFDNPTLIEKFCQHDAVRFGVIAISGILFNTEPSLLKQRFNEIKTKMLDSGSSSSNYSSSVKNSYPYQIAGEKSSTANSHNTTILYTINGKRDLFEITINELLENPTLLEKFHPTVAIKLGAISMGESLIHENQICSAQPSVNAVKEQMLKPTEV